MNWALLFTALLLAACGRSPRESIVLYTSQDQFYAEPILREFTRQTGIEVKPVFDTESAKTAGLANRLRHESSRPQCDVFWSNEEMHTHVLAAEGSLRPDAIQTAGFRTRRLVVNTNLFEMAGPLPDLPALTNATWKGRVVLAYPLYGTTSSHFLALRQTWGAERWILWCEALARNETKVVDGNSAVVRLVGAGEAWIGLTDSDDIAAGKRNGLPVEQLPLNGEMLAIPNTIVIVRQENEATAQRLVDFLVSAPTIEQLIHLGALEGREPPKTELTIEWSRAQRDLAETAETLKRIFVRS